MRSSIPLRLAAASVRSRVLFFGPGGNLYVSSNTAVSGIGGSGEILRFNGSTGAFIDTFIQTGVGDTTPGPTYVLSQAMSLAFGADGNLYIGNDSSGVGVGVGAGGGGANVLRYNASSGAFVDAFVIDGTLLDPKGMIFGPNGKLYVSHEKTFLGAGEVLVYHTATGGLLNTITNAGLDEPHGLIFGPDGKLYGVSSDSSEVLRFAADGSFDTTFIAPNAGGVGRRQRHCLSGHGRRARAVKPGGGGPGIAGLVGRVSPRRDPAEPA